MAKSVWEAIAYVLRFYPLTVAIIIFLCRHTLELEVRSLVRVA
ncbi:MAG TPA: hypothetical protein V6D35_11660 [Candidatus Sericytochromatia bacterium]